MVRIICKPRVRMIYLYSFGRALAATCSKYSVISCNEREKLVQPPWAGPGYFVLSIDWTKCNENVILVGRFMGD